MGLRRSLRRLLSADKVKEQEHPSGWLTDNVFCQSPTMPLSESLQHFDPRFRDPDPVNLVHIVNFYSIAGALDDVQSLTLKSMLAARANPLAGHGATSLCQVPVLGDQHLFDVWNGLSTTAPLERTIADLGTFNVSRRLPLLFDILERGATVAEPDDYLIYTNSDICLQPNFYGAVRQLIGAGFDAFTVNRRTFADNTFSHFDPLTLAEVGSNHRGYDCFVFSRRLFDEFVRADSCLGIAAVARPLLYNLVAHSRKMLMLKNVNLTFHIGNDQPWRDNLFCDYRQHNAREVQKCLTKLASRPQPASRLRRFCKNHKESWRP